MEASAFSIFFFVAFGLRVFNVAYSTQMYATGMDLVFDPEHKGKHHKITDRGRTLVRDHVPVSTLLWNKKRIGCVLEGAG
jgi:hypothetical protein